jgi:hypothetical protein
MSLISSLGKAISNPFVRQIAGGLAGLISGTKGADFVNRGFTLFDNLKSAFAEFKNPGSADFQTTSNSSLRDPRTAGVGTSTYASTAATSSGSLSDISGDIGSTVARDVGGAAGAGYGLTGDQRQMLLDAGLKPGSQEWKQQELQLKIANYKNLMELMSNIGKMLTDLSASIIRNIRS